MEIDYTFTKKRLDYINETYPETEPVADHVVEVVEMMSVIERTLLGREEELAKKWLKIKPDVTVEYLQKKYLSLMKCFAILHERAYSNPDRHGSREDRLRTWISSDTQKHEIFAIVSLPELNIN